MASSYASTQARDYELLALITADTGHDIGLSRPRPSYGLAPGLVLKLSFVMGYPNSNSSTDPGDAFATGFYFRDKATAHQVLTEEEMDDATVWHGAYVFRGNMHP